MFSCFVQNSKSIVNLFASTACIIHFIKASDLENLGKEIFDLKDRLKVIKLRIKNKMVDDIDYFTFPKRHLQNEINKKSVKHMNLFGQNYRASKKVMLHALINYSKLVKNGYCKLPKALHLLDKIR